MKFLVRTALVLICAAFFSEVAELIINIILARELGETGMGHYMTILPLIFLIMMLASFELPISLSKLVAEHESAYHKNMLREVLHLAIILSAALMIAAAVLLPFVPAFYEFPPIFKWVIVALIPLMTCSSVARGYFMGRQEVGKIAVANLSRRLVQLLLLAGIYQYLEFGGTASLLVALFTVAASELVVFVYLLTSFTVRYQALKRLPAKGVDRKIIQKSLLAVSGPGTALRIFHAITHAVQPFFIKAAIVQAGLPAEMANGQFGLLAGGAMAIGFFPAFIAHSFSILLVPLVARHEAEGEVGKLQKLLQHVILLTVSYGLPAAAVFYFFAEPLTDLFFHSGEAAYFLQILWPYFLLHFFVIPLQAYLIGLGLIRDAVYHSVWSTLISFSMIYLLGTRPEWRMTGVIIGMNTGVMVLTLLHYMTICKKIGLVWTTKALGRRI